MKVATFNINGVNGRLANLLEWLAEAEPDVVALQEIKCTNAAFPRAALEAAGHGAVWRGQGPHHGVSILARGAEPVLTRRELPGDPDDHEARYIEAAVGGVLVGCLYLPNGNPRPGPKFDYKLRWFERLNAYAAQLIAADVPALLIGDYNVVPTDGDIYATASFRENALLQPEPRPPTPDSSARAGPTPSATCTQAKRSTRSGTTSGTAGRETPACASTTCWSRRCSCHG